MEKIKIAVVGPIPNDTIKTYKGEIVTKYGCVTHPTIALAKLLENRGSVIPISHVHKKDHKGIVELFHKYKSIDVSGVSSKKNQGTDIELVFVDQNNRIETQLSNMSPITPEDIEPFLDVDSFVFVPITDFEVSLDTLKFIKKNSEAPIIFDAHGPTTYVNEHGKRLRQYWKDVKEWLPYIDILKMNLEESLCSWFDKDYTNEEFDEDDTGHLDEFADFVLSHGPRALYVTLDSRGCALYYKDGDVIIKDFVSSIPVKDVIDTTGCGDSFAGGLAFGIAMYDDLYKAAHFANTLGAFRTQGKGFEVFKSLEETEKTISKFY
ncbi:MAG: PfkB family carbohydrate kinase [Flavobacteriaceae bacterium]|nr:PfkB family carbohydrate kinase [Flavobacteriaceae bacterium]